MMNVLRTLEPNSTAMVTETINLGSSITFVALYRLPLILNDGIEQFNAN